MTVAKKTLMISGVVCFGLVWYGMFFSLIGVALVWNTLLCLQEA